MAYLTENEASQLLGRSLTTTEVNSFDVWEDVAESQLADLLCVQNLDELGFETLPKDLALVLARLTVAIGTENEIPLGVASKKVEDFSINYDTATRNDFFANLAKVNAPTLAKYSHCGIRYGRTLKEEARYYHNDRF
jgi:hypothetical protein